MTIIEESALAQTIKFIPRKFTLGNSYNISIVNESTNTEVYNQDTTEIAELLYYNTYTAVFPVKQDIYYMLTIKDGTEVIFKDKVFSTNQAVANYTVNNNEYISNDTQNEFIFA